MHRIRLPDIPKDLFGRYIPGVYRDLENHAFFVSKSHEIFLCDGNIIDEGSSKIVYKADKLSNDGPDCSFDTADEYVLLFSTDSEEDLRVEYERTKSKIAGFHYDLRIERSIEGQSRWVLLPNLGKALDDSEIRQYLLNNPVCERARICWQICQQIQRIHSPSGVGKLLHCDLKPANILVKIVRVGETVGDGDTSSIGKTTIIDFGSALPCPDSANPVKSDYVKGTATYVAPESAKKDGNFYNFYRASDIYSFVGLVLGILSGGNYGDALGGRRSAQYIERDGSYNAESFESFYIDVLNDDVDNALLPHVKAFLERMQDQDPLKRPEINEVSRFFHAFFYAILAVGGSEANRPLAAGKLAALVNPPKSESKPFYKNWKFWAIVAGVTLGLGLATGGFALLIVLKVVTIAAISVGIGMLLAKFVAPGIAGAAIIPTVTSLVQGLLGRKKNKTAAGDEAVARPGKESAVGQQGEPSIGAVAPGPPPPALVVPAASPPAPGQQGIVAAMRAGMGAGAEVK